MIRTIMVKPYIDDYSQSSFDGTLLFNDIEKHLDNGDNVVLDFGEVPYLTTHFLNTSIARLYGSYEFDFVRNRVSAINMSQDDTYIVRLVIDAAKEFWKTKEEKNGNT